MALTGKRRLSLAVAMSCVLLIVLGGVRHAGAEPNNRSTAQAAAPTGPPPPPERMVNGDFPDPSVVVDGTHLYAYTTNINLFGTWFNTPVWDSTDNGSTWLLRADGLPSPGTWTEGQGFVWGPGAIQLANGTWNLYYSARLANSTADPAFLGAGMECLGVATASTPTGPFVNRPTAFGTLGCQWDMGGTIDPKPIFDDSGSLHLVSKSDENAPYIRRKARLWSSALAVDGLTIISSALQLLVSDQSWESGVIENPTMFKTGDQWWLVYSGGRWDSASYGTGIARCAGLAGPCSKVGTSPWLTSNLGIAGPGGADFYRRADGALFMAFAAWDPGAIGLAIGSRNGFGQRVAASEFGLEIASPFGDVNSVVIGATVGSVTANGWAIDPDTTDAIAVSMSIDGVWAASSQADTYRPDVSTRSTWTGYGPNHGYSISAPVGPGVHEICVSGINVGTGEDAHVGCRSIEVLAGIPFGGVDPVVGTLNAVTVTGAAADPSDPVAAISVSIAIDGGQDTDVVADINRPGYDLINPGYGTAHGFAASIPAMAGSHEVCVTARNVGAGADGMVGCQQVTVLGPAGRFTLLTVPNRIVDSRSGVGGYFGKVLQGGTRDFKVAGTDGIPVDATAMALTVTVTEPDLGGFVTVSPSGQPRPLASNLNFASGQTIANAVVVGVGTDDSFSVYASARLHVIVDVTGFYRVDPTAAGFTPLAAPVRALDSRSGIGGLTGKWTPRTTRSIRVAGVHDVPDDASAVVVNLTSTESESPGFVTAFASGQTLPIASNVNFGTGSTVANLATIKVGVDGFVSLYSLAATHLVVDVVGYYRVGSGEAFVAVVPRRALDSRVDPQYVTRWPAGVTRDISILGDFGVIAGATAAVLTVIAVDPLGAGYLAVFPAGEPEPTTSNVNYVQGQTIPNLTFDRLGLSGNVSLRVAVGATDLVVDVAGYFIDESKIVP